MAGTAYHMEALRKVRVIERKRAAMEKIKQMYGQNTGVTFGLEDINKQPLVLSEPAHDPQNSQCQEQIHHKQRRAINQGKDKVMPLLHPQEHVCIGPLTQMSPRKPHYKV